MPPSCNRSLSNVRIRALPEAYSYRAERRNLEAVHGDRVRGEGVEDPKDEEKLEEYREP